VRAIGDLFGVDRLREELIYRVALLAEKLVDGHIPPLCEYTSS
jgi:hypothetical protein